MVTAPSAPVVPPEVSETIGNLQTEIEKLQHELAQALEVWKSTLGAEQTQFEEFVRHKELAWQEQENQWALQSQAYEQRLEALTADFESRLKANEQNASRTLSELDDAWQHDKLEWGPSARDEWPAQKRALEERVRSLETELSGERRLRGEEREEAQVRLREMEGRLKGAAAGPTASTVQALEEQLQTFQQTVAAFQDRAAHSDELVGACVQALDYQISVLYDLVHHYADESSGAAPSPDLAQP